MSRERFWNWYKSVYGESPGWQWWLDWKKHPALETWKSLGMPEAGKGVKPGQQVEVAAPEAGLSPEVKAAWDIYQRTGTKPFGIEFPDELLAEELTNKINALLYRNKISYETAVQEISYIQSQLNQGTPLSEIETYKWASDPDEARLGFEMGRIDEGVETEATRKREAAQEEYEITAQARMAPWLYEKYIFAPQRAKAEQQRIDAEGGAFRPRTQRAPFEPEPIPSATAQLPPFLEKLSPNLQRFWAGREEELVEPIENARRLWWNTIQAQQRDVFEAERGAQAAAAGASIKEAAGEFDAAAAIRGEAEEMERASGRDITIGTDPLAAYLKGQPWMEKYFKTPPRQRGEFPSRFAPPAVWR